MEFVIVDRKKINGEGVIIGIKLGNQTEYSYLPDEQIKEIRRNTGKESKCLQSYEYNARGQMIGVVDSVKENYEYTPSGQIKRAVDGNGHAVSSQHNRQGKTSVRTDQAGDEEIFRYDEDGNGNRIKKRESSG